MPATPTATAPQTSTPTGTFPPTASPTPTDTPAGPGTYGLSGHVLYYGNARPVGGATVQLQAATPATVQTDALGQFAFTGLEAGTTSLTPVKLGGWGTAISALDAAWVLQSTVGLRVLSAQQKLAADVTGNGTVSSLDASVILQYTVGLATTFRVATICGSDWLFVPVPAAAASQTLVQPQIATGTCVPGSIGFSPLAGDAAGQDFAGIVFGDVTGNWQPPPPASPSLAARQAATTPARVGLAVARRRGAGRVELPIVVENAASVHALDLWLSYDAARLVAVEVRRLHAARGALMAVNDHVPGEIRIALASAGPIETADAAVLVVLFDAASGGAASSVHPLEAAIDGRPVPTLD